MTRQQYLIYPEALTVGEIKIGGSVLVTTVLNPRTAPSVFSASPAPAGSPCSPNSNPSARSRPCLRNARRVNRGDVSPVFANLALARRARRRNLLAHGGQAVGWQLCL